MYKFITLLSHQQYNNYHLWLSLSVLRFPQQRQAFYLRTLKNDTQTEK